MSNFYYPALQTMPNTVNFEPTGGPNGDPCFKLDQQGSQPTILAMRVPPIKLDDWDTSLEYKIDTTDLQVTANGFEGCGARSRLLRAGPTAPIVLSDSGLFNGQSDDWHTVITGWHNVTQRISHGINVAPDAEDIQFAVRGPVGGSVKISQLNLVNQYTRTYDIEVLGQSDNIALTRRGDGITRIISGSGGASSSAVSSAFGDTWWESFLDTIPINVNTNDTIEIQATAVMSATSDSASDVPIRLGLYAKLRDGAGFEIWKQIVRHSNATAFFTDTVLQNAINWRAETNYNQLEGVIRFNTAFGREHGVTVGHKGIQIQITVKRPLLSNG